MINSTLDIDYSDLHHGKYDCSMAQYISLRIMGEGDYGDDELETGDMEGIARYGRRVFGWDDLRFVWCDTYDTEGEAQELIAKVQKEMDDRQDEVCKEQGCKPCVCGGYDCVAHEPGCSHVNGCERDWIG